MVLCGFEIELGVDWGCFVVFLGGLGWFGAVWGGLGSFNGPTEMSSDPGYLDPKPSRSGTHRPKSIFFCGTPRPGIHRPIFEKVQKRAARFVPTKKYLVKASARCVGGGFATGCVSITGTPWICMPGMYGHLKLPFF